MELRTVCVETDNEIRLVGFYKILLREEPLAEGSHYGFKKLSVYNPGSVIVAKEKNIWLLFGVSDLDAEYGRLLKEIPDIEVISPPERKPWGACSFQIADPDGNKISVFQE